MKRSGGQEGRKSSFGLRNYWAAACLPGIKISHRRERFIMSANISILGNTGRDVSLRYSESGLAIASFPIACNSFKNSLEGRVQITHWFDVTAFGKTAETLAQNAKKGTPLLIHGRLSFEPWSTEKNEPRSGAQVALFSFDFAGENKSEGQEADPLIGSNPEPPTPEYTGPVNALSPITEPFTNQF